MICRVSSADTELLDRAARRFAGNANGRGLLRSFMAAEAQLGASKMFLITGEENGAARNLYESMGAGLAAQGPTVNYWFLLPPVSSAPEAASSGRSVDSSA